MNRFFRSALFPLIVIVLLVYLASQTLIPKSKAPEKQTYSQLIQLVQNDPGSIKEVVFNPSKHQIVATLNDQDAKKVKVNYPSDQSQIQFQRLLQTEEGHLRLEGHRLVAVVVDPHLAAAVRAPARLLDLHDELDAGRRLEGDVLRQEPRQADGARLAEDRVQGRRRRGRGGRGAPGDQGVPGEPEEVPGARRADPQGRAALRAARHRQDAARPRGRRRGGRAVLLDLGLRLRRDVRRRRRLARPRPVRAGQAGGAVHRLHGRDRRRRPSPRRRPRRRPRRARADAEPAPRRDGRVRAEGQHHPDRGHEPARHPRPGAAAPRPLRPADRRRPARPQRPPQDPRGAREGQAARVRGRPRHARRRHARLHRRRPREPRQRGRAARRPPRQEGRASRRSSRRGSCA